jgi:hypothetical protein
VSVVMVPPIEDGEPWPTLGPQVCALMEEALVFGPGDLRGRPYRLDDEDRAFVYSAYEVYPVMHKGACVHDARGFCTRGNGKCGRRRFDAVFLMIRKGSKKSERMGAFAAAELHPEAPVRCDGFRLEGGQWHPIGRPVTDPYIPIVAYTQTQAEDTAFASLYTMIAEGPHADRFDIQQERILRLRGDGKAEALATAPDSRDGGRTTFQVKEEPHRWTLPRQHEAHATMTANLAKRPIAEPWEAFATTAYAPGEDSVAERIHRDANRLLEGEDGGRSSRIFFFYRWADESIDIETPEGLRRAIVEASGPTIAAWSDVDRIANLFTAAGADQGYLARTWLNRVQRGASRAFDAVRWSELAMRGPHEVPPGALVVAGFDGSRFDDATALVATEVATGYQWPVGIWQRPPTMPAHLSWEVPRLDVDAAVDALFATFDVWRLYADPPDWDSEIAAWAGRHGRDRIVDWFTWRRTPMSYALRAYSTAMATGEVVHCAEGEGEEVGYRSTRCRLFSAHVGAAVRKATGKRDDIGDLWIIEKEGPSSPAKIDAAMAAVLSWEARNDALAAGALNVPDPGVSAYETSSSILT